MRGLVALLPATRRIAAASASSRAAFPSAGAPRRASSVAAPAGGITIRYFDSRGRAQALRYALVDSGLEFKDDKVAISHIISGNWFNMKNNVAVSGLWGTLPILQWGETQVAQTEAIAGFLYNVLGHDASGVGGPAAAAASASLTSLGHQDVIVLCLQLVNMVGVMQHAKDEELAQNVQGVQVRLNAFLPRIETLATKRMDLDKYLVLDTPTMGDYYIFEACQVVSLVLGSQVLEGYPGIKAFIDKMQARPAMSAYIASGNRPLTLTGSPHEPGIIQKLQGLPKL